VETKVSEQSAEARALVRRTCLVYLTIFAWSGFNQPYLPLWLTERGLTAPQIAWVIGLPMFLRLLFTPAIGRIADGMADRRVLIRVASVAACAAATALWFAESFWSILPLYVLTILLLQNVSPIFDANALDLVRKGIAADFGRMRLWGSAGYALTSFAGGWILLYGGSEAVFAAFLGALGALALAAFAQSAPPKSPKPAPEIGPMRRPAVAAMTVAAALVLGSQATWNGFGTLHLRALGVPDEIVGALWALSTCAEIAMFWAGPFLAARLGPLGVLATAAVFSVMRWGLMALDPGPVATAFLQLLHAATFSCAHLGLMSFFAVAVGSGRGASAQAAFVTVSSVTLGLATIASGPLYREFGGFAYLFAASLGLAALALLFAFRRGIARELSKGRAR
jgi:MFS transporter, PPP family, 3-phenylpropionic acid transporter